MDLLIKRKMSSLIIAGYVFIALIGFALLFNRIFYGIDFTDESWYVAEPYIVANGGVIPYVNNWTQAPGFTIPLAFLFKIYVTITGGTEGIVLFSRLLYVAFVVIVYGGAVYILARKINCWHVLIIIFPLTFINAYSLYDLNYDTMGVMYLFLSIIILMFWQEQKRIGGLVILPTFFAGIIIARGIIASPSVLAGWGVLLVIMIICKKWDKLFNFLAGNALAAILVVGWCCLKGGIRGFLNGMRVFLSETSYFKIEQSHTLKDDFIYVCNYCKPLLFTLLFLGVVKILYNKKRFLRKLHCEYIVITICGALLLFGIVKGMNSGNYLEAIQYSWYITIILAVFGEIREKIVICKFACITIIYFAVYLLTSETNVYGFGGREYWLIIPVCLGYGSFVYIFHDTYRVIFSVILITLLFGGLLIKHNYEYVYREQSMTALTTKVNYGIWKGLYTTEERAINVELLERYIREITCDNDNVLFLDQACFAYMMTNAKACTTTSLDPLVWTYKANNVIIMEEYYKSTGKIPNKIIYIDFGRDAMLSIDSEWAFNDFVNENYILADVYDTDPLVLDKHEKSPMDTSSFYVKYYKKKK